MIVDLVLGAIFITAIICFTVYKINKNNVGKNTKYFSEDKDESSDNLKERLKDLSNKDNEQAIGFQFKKEKKTLRKEDDRDDKD